MEKCAERTNRLLSIITEVDRNIVIAFNITLSLFPSTCSLPTDLEDESAPNRLKYDEERKYGTIPTRIYLLYLKACGIPTLVVFFTSTFMWQALRVYTDVWLSQWTEINDGSDVCVPLNLLCLSF